MGDGKEPAAMQFSVKTEAALRRKRENTEPMKLAYSKKQKAKEPNQNNQRRCGEDQQCWKEESEFSVLKENPGQEKLIISSEHVTKPVEAGNRGELSTEEGQVTRPQQGPQDTVEVAPSGHVVLSEDGVCSTDKNRVCEAAVEADRRGGGCTSRLSGPQGQGSGRTGSSGQDSVTAKSKEKNKENQSQEKREGKLQEQGSGRRTGAAGPEKEEEGSEEETARGWTGSPAPLGKGGGQGHGGQGHGGQGHGGQGHGGQGHRKGAGQQGHGEGKGVERGRGETKADRERAIARKKRLVDVRKIEALLGRKQTQSKKNREGKDAWVGRIKTEVNGKLGADAEVEKTRKDKSRPGATVSSEKRRKVEGRDLEKDGRTDERRVWCASERGRAGEGAGGAGGKGEVVGAGAPEAGAQGGATAGEAAGEAAALRQGEAQQASAPAQPRGGKGERTAGPQKVLTEGGRWKWWEEEKREDGVKWKQLEHKGPYFAPPYEPLPEEVRFYYDGKPVKLSSAAEEVATFYGKMLDHEYATKEVFQSNFFSDWRKEMTAEERKVIKHLDKCDFTEIHRHFMDRSTARKALPREEKQKLKEEAEKLQQEFGYCILDGHREKIGNFKTEPPGLFRGRGDHPKMGMLKRRVVPEDVIINCSRDSQIPVPPAGHSWKEVRCDRTVTWLASWTENIQSSIKYVMLNPSSKLKGEKDWQKYELARRLKGVVGQIRAQYRADWKSREMKTRQRAVALYFIDKLALRAGNEKEEGETADTVGCCSLRVEHVQLLAEAGGQERVVELDFLGKDSIRYYNRVPVEKPVYRNLLLFMENKGPRDELFDRLTTTSLNRHLQDLMDGLTAKVFRTYNASVTLQEQLRALTRAEDSVAAKILSYNRATRAVAVLCNHQRATPKTFARSMRSLQEKIEAKKERVAQARAELKKVKAEHGARADGKSQSFLEKQRRLLERLEEQLVKLTMQATDKEENKQVALGTSKLNYLDPRISVAWCRRFAVPVEKIYNKTQREKFAWAIDMAGEDFEF